MGLVVTNLEKDILSAFQSMNDGSNKVFSEKISAAVKKFAESGDVVTVDKGTVSAGVYAGAGTGGIKVDESVCEKIIFAACGNMDKLKAGHNTYLATEMADGIHAMILDGDIETDVKGMVTPPSSSPVTLNGKAKGKLTGVSVPMQAAFVNTVNSMDGMTTGNDEYMAKQCSIAVNAYLIAAIASTNGNVPLVGSTGTGKMT